MIKNLKLTYRIIRQIYSPIKYNVFKTKHEKTALLSYLTVPFDNRIDFNHTKNKECYTLAEILKTLEYNVDVIDYNSLRQLDYSKYSLIIGFGEPFEKAFNSKTINSIVTVLYSTGCNTTFSNSITLKRILNFRNTKNAFLPDSSRYVDYSWRKQVYFSDGLIILGNEFTEKTYLKEIPEANTYQVSLFFHKTLELDLATKNFNKSKKNFLWFGGTGLIHKGLDLCLEIFAKRSDLNLHICGPIKNDKEFESYYFSYLFKTSNIFNHDFVDINSIEFKEILSNCAFIIFPSASEGSCPSVLTSMGNGGLIPIISEASGIDVQDFGFTFNSLNINEIEECINEALKLNNKQLYDRSKKVLEYTNKEHSYSKYKETILSSILDIITEKNPI